MNEKYIERREERKEKERKHLIREANTEFHNYMRNKNIEDEIKKQQLKNKIENF